MCSFSFLYLFYFSFFNLRKKLYLIIFVYWRQPEKGFTCNTSSNFCLLNVNKKVQYVILVIFISIIVYSYQASTSERR